MAERRNNPISTACAQWETLLADALDGLLKPGDEAAFTAHVAACPVCAALFEDARRGREWLGFLSTEPEVPAGLLDKILARTGPGQVETYGLAAGSGNVLPKPAVFAPAREVPLPEVPIWQRPGFLSSVRRFAEPRLLMTAAMAFFSISVTLSVTNVRLSNLRLASLRPAAVRSFMERRLTMASTPIVRYYDHSHFVYEVETRMRELRRATQGEGLGVGGENDNRQKPNDTAPGESRQSPARKDGGSPMEAPQQSGNPATGPALDDSNNFDETSLKLSSPAFQARPALSGGSAMEERERSTIWIA
jgi:hypothetical protein